LSENRMQRAIAEARATGRLGTGIRNRDIFLSELEGVYVDEPFYMDLSFFKNIRLPKSTNIQFRAELFNATNVVQWNAPNTTITSTQFGTVADNQANDPRNIMISVRFSF